MRLVDELNIVNIKATEAWSNRNLNPRRIEAITKHAGKSFLDVGCGNGSYVRHFSKDYETLGVDIHSYPSWQEMPEKFRSVDGVSLPFDDNSFETVIGFEVLEHIHDPELALQEFRRVCSKNIIITAPNCQLSPGMEQSRLAYYHFTDQTHCNFFTLDSLENLVNASGFKVINKQLINPSNLLPFFQEAFIGPKVFLKLVHRLLTRREYNMTCLIVAEKIS